MYVYYNDINNNVINRTNGVDTKNKNPIKTNATFTTGSHGRAATRPGSCCCRRSFVSSIYAVIKIYNRGTLATRGRRTRTCDRPLFPPFDHGRVYGHRFSLRTRLWKRHGATIAGENAVMAPCSRGSRRRILQPVGSMADTGFAVGKLFVDINRMEITRVSYTATRGLWTQTGPSFRKSARKGGPVGAMRLPSLLRANVRIGYEYINEN